MPDSNPVSEALRKVAKKRNAERERVESNIAMAKLAYVQHGQYAALIAAGRPLNNAVTEPVLWEGDYS